MAGVVAAARDLDLDDVGAEVAEHHRAVRPDHDAGEVDDSHTGQRPASLLLPGRPDVSALFDRHRPYPPLAVQRELRRGSLAAAVY
jgi:hypothetical protein